MLLKDKITAIFCLVDNSLKGIGHQEDLCRKVSDSELITTAMVLALYFGGHQDHTRSFMKITRLCPDMLDKSHYNRPMHALEPLLLSLFFQVGQYLKDISGAKSYIIDSITVAVCDNIMIRRSRIVKGEQWRGKQSTCAATFMESRRPQLRYKCWLPKKGHRWNLVLFPEAKAMYRP